MEFIWGRLRSIRDHLERVRSRRRWARLRELGMHIGDSVWLPADTWIDSSHCHLISIGDNCGFGARCLILAHDAQMNEFLGATRLGTVVIHESSHIGAGCIILPGVEIGPRTVVGAGSVVSRSLPPDSVCVGSPAVPMSTLDEYLDKHRRRLDEATTFDVDRYVQGMLTPSGRAEMVAACEGLAYMVGNGWVDDLAGRRRTERMAESVFSRRMG